MPEICTKFQELEWQQQLRIAQGRTDPNSPWTQDMTNLVRLRNRYLNVQPWEKCRVRLQVPEGKSDYINASPVSLQESRRDIDAAFIVSQVSCVTPALLQPPSFELNERSSRGRKTLAWIIFGRWYGKRLLIQWSLSCLLKQPRPVERSVLNIFHLAMRPGNFDQKLMTWKSCQKGA